MRVDDAAESPAGGGYVTLGQAIGDPGSIVSRHDGESITKWSERAVREVLRREAEPLAAFDLRLRSLDRRAGEPLNACSGCGGIASWSVWLHTPEWGPGNAGLTLVMCRACALEQIEKEARRGTR